MNANAPDEQLLSAIGSFYRDNPVRIQQQVVDFRKGEKVIESRIKGTSMGNTIADQSRIRIQFGKPDDCRVGQVIAFLNGSRLMVHRIVYRGRFGRSREYFITQGDGRITPDLPVKFDTVLGPVREVEFHGSWTTLNTGENPTVTAALFRRILVYWVAAALEINVSAARGLAWLFHSVGYHPLIQRVIQSSTRFRSAYLSGSLGTEEKSRLTVSLYDANRLHRGGALSPWGDGLAEWEKTWFQSRLPKPPARILLGACGHGREALALLDSGFEVDAFEPAPSIASSARTLVGDRGSVFTFSYEDLNTAILDGTQNNASALKDRHYDAVILGWTSLSHVLDRAERLRLFRVLHALCPDGPILASIWRTPPAQRNERPGRAFRLGYSMGRLVARLQGAQSSTAPQTFASHRGFILILSNGDIEELGNVVGRKALWEQDAAYPRVTFLSEG